MKSRPRNRIGRKQRRSQDPRKKRKMRHSWRDFLMVRSVLLQIMIIVLFLSRYFQCQLCPKKIMPTTAGNCRYHLKREHTKEKNKCQWPGCNYVRTFAIYTLSTMFMQETADAEREKMTRHVANHEGLNRVNCPCCGSNIVR